MIAWLATDTSPSMSDSGAFGCQFLRRTSSASDGVSNQNDPGFDRTGGAVGVDEDALGGASRLDQSEAARRNAALEKPLSFAEHQRKDPDAIFVDSGPPGDCMTP